MANTVSKSKLVSTIAEASDVFKFCAKKTKILASLSWDPKVAAEFLAAKGTVIPKPTYNVDRTSGEKAMEQLKALEPKLKGDDPALIWLRRTHQSYCNGVRLLGELENKTFHEVSSALYGNPKSIPYEGGKSNLALASALLSRLETVSINDITEKQASISSEEFAEKLALKLKARTPEIPVRVEITDDIVAKVVAGMNRVRIRRDARFAVMDLDALWNHEIESHCLTAHNGAHHNGCDFLTSGGPRTTMTQEGLAVFHEIYGHTMSQHRFWSLCHRIQAIDKVEAGADFIELYRWYRDRCESDSEAFYATQRVFRGAPLTGGAPFTKDVVYLGGLLGIYNFLRIAVKTQNHLLIESLVCGRIALEDVTTIAWLRSHGILNPPKFVPKWLENWEALLSFFSFSAYLNHIDLSAFQNYFDSQNIFQSWDYSLY
ncbi:MAG: DUF1704 domain-containing protein [Deltaproteobacteria bacterium]|nr:DUF1704 domain-containing protein [Deltaproteobacteria bacterium]MBI3295661.1 DUF1704 domain-containing protein [Deltaproteobacteria bacterium]